MITSMPGTANLNHTNLTQPHPGDEGWIDEAGKDVGRVIAVERDRVFFVHAARSYWDRDAQEWVMKEGIPTCQVWKRWRRKPCFYTVDVRPALTGEEVLMGGVGGIHPHRQEYDTSNDMIVVLERRFG